MKVRAQKQQKKLLMEPKADSFEKKQNNNKIAKFYPDRSKEKN